ncbi:hypothetical protein [Spirulina sp. 06S082]|uniref:hypothetical protein n=1 Tax=Spirulina sp. 06S082 TaxID=3110248 RepID=UPI002B20FCB0|nr:hypothetical protein [Spirulina sp. 06S082]MEA5468637.1 hypothetical protein [Spirulina sp. 06S082]
MTEDMIITNAAPSCNRRGKATFSRHSASARHSTRSRSPSMETKSPTRNAVALTATADSASTGSRCY